MSIENKRSKSFKQKDIVLYIVSAILLLDTLAATASIGTQSLFWWLFLGTIFFLPFGLISAELGCSYPEAGGIYAWVRNAFGKTWGSRISWSYWVNVAIWLPAIFILFSGIVRQLFFPDLSTGAQVTIAIFFTWVAVAMNVVSLDIGKWVPNIGAIFKVVIFLIIIIGAFNYVQTHGLANEFSLQSMAPDWQASLQFIPAIIYGMLGFELVSASSNDIENPERNIPRSILVSGIIIITLYMLGTAAILAAIPAENIDLVEGLIDTLRLFFAEVPGGDGWVIIIGLMALYTFFSNAVTWSMGANRAAAEAAEDGELPALFGIHNEKRGTPVGAAVSMGVISTVIIIVYSFLLGTNEDLFWSLFAFSGVIFLWPYIGMILAFIKLRLTDADHPRPFKVRGNLAFVSLMSAVCVIVLLISIVLFIYTPSEGIQWPVLIGSISAILLGEVVVRIAARS